MIENVTKHRITVERYKDGVHLSFREPDGYEHLYYLDGREVDELADALVMLGFDGRKRGRA